VVPLPVAKKLNGSQPLEQYDAAQNDITQIEPANANTPSVRPTAISPIFANIPAELKERPNWLMWTFLLPERPGQKWRKVPFQTNGKHAKANDSATWNSFGACCEAYNLGGFDGIGFVFDGKADADGLCYAGADFDRCIKDGKLVEPARSRVGLLQTYTEQSVSGTGIHSIVRAKPGSTVKYNSVENGHSVEIYSGGRYFTFTGVPWGENCGAIRAAVSEVDALVKEARAQTDAKHPAGGSQRDAKLAELFVDPTMANHGPSAIFRGMEIESLGEGTKDHWFDKLTPERKDAAVHYMMSMIAANTKLLELSDNGGNNDDYFKLMTALALSGAPHAEDCFVEFASKVENADSEETLRAEFRRCQKAADGRITVGTLLKYAHDARADWSQWRSQAEATPPAQMLPLPFINMSAWDNEPLPEREWAVPNRIPLRQLGLFSGEGGAGKSYVTLHLCVAHVFGRDWLNSMPTPGPAIFMDAEDDENELHIRLGSILRHYNATNADAVKCGLHLLSFVGRDAVLATAGRYNSKIEPTPLYGQLLQAAGDIKPKMIGIASAANIFAGNENDRSQVQQFAALLTRIAQVANGSVQLISHPSLTGINSDSGLSGSTQWHNAVRARSYLKGVKAEDGQQPDGDLRQLEFKKNQYGPLSDVVILRYQHGMFLPEHGVLALDKLKQMEIAKEVFLALIDRFNMSNRTVSDKPGRNYAPSLFVEEDEAKKAGLSNKVLQAAMRQLFSANKIWNEPCGKPSRPSYRIARGMNPILRGKAS
jgi:RecA-family ATPase